MRHIALVQIQTACKAVSFDPQQPYEQPSVTIRSNIKHTGEEI